MVVYLNRLKRQMPISMLGGLDQGKASGILHA